MQYQIAALYKFLHCQVASIAMKEVAGTGAGITSMTIMSSHATHK